jgi:hypothetical protein
MKCRKVVEAGLKRNPNSLLAASAVAALLVLSLAPSAQASEGCTVATLEGSYGEVHGGTIFDQGLSTAVGLWTFDGKGNYFAAVTNVFEDTGVSRATFAGQYIVNADCTASLEIQGGPLADLAIVDGGKELRYIATRPNRVATGVFKRQALEACTNAVIEGRYGLTLNGKIRDRGLAGAVGFLTFDGKGSASYAATAVYEDTGLDHVTLEGSYTVNPNCTGSLLLGASATFEFVIVGDGEEILQVATQSDRVVTWTMKKQ